jgi:hypothetical protein
MGLEGVEDVEDAQEQVLWTGSPGSKMSMNGGGMKVGERTSIMIWKK